MHLESGWRVVVGGIGIDDESFGAVARIMILIILILMIITLVLIIILISIIVAIVVVAAIVDVVSMAFFDRR